MNEHPVATAARSALTEVTGLPCTGDAAMLCLGTYRWDLAIWDAPPIRTDLERAATAMNGRIAVLRFVAPNLARALRAAGIAYVDSVGNAWIRWPEGVIAIEGRPAPPEARRARPPERAGGLRLLLALAVDPDLPSEQVRTIARRSGASLGTIVNVLSRLRDEGRISAGARILDPDSLADRFAAAWAESLRATQFVARARPASGVPVGESIEWMRGAGDSLVGGEAGALLLLGDDVTRARQATLHLPSIGPATWRALRLTPDEKGPIHLVRRFAAPEVGPSIEGLGVAHPVSVRAELDALILTGETQLSVLRNRVAALPAVR
jgi:hypothetical protein